MKAAPLGLCISNIVERHVWRLWACIAKGALKAARALPAVQNLPASVKLGESGSAEILAELQSGFAIAIAIVTAIITAYCVLVLLFKDFVQPITILSALPLSLGGAFVALLAANSEFDLAVLLGS
jgi:multidrug efflux pump subunit AcrB